MLANKAQQTTRKDTDKGRERNRRSGRFDTRKQRHDEKTLKKDKGRTIHKDKLHGRLKK